MARIGSCRFCNFRTLNSDTCKECKDIIVENFDNNLSREEIAELAYARRYNEAQEASRKNLEKFSKCPTCGRGPYGS